MINVLSLPNLKSRGQSNIKLVGKAYHMGLELSGSLVPRPSLNFCCLGTRLTKQYNVMVTTEKVHMDPFLSI